MKTDEFDAALREALARRAAEVPQTAIDQLRRVNYRPYARHRLVMASTGLVAAAAAAAVAAASLMVAGPKAGDASATHLLQARLLAAISAARGDIVMTYGPHGPHNGYDLVYPWYPRPGQRVTSRVLGWGADGTLYIDAERIFAMPSGHSAPAMSSVTGSAVLPVTGTLIVVYHAEHAWGEWHHTNTVVELPVGAAGIRHQLAKGQFKIIRRDVVNGHKAIKLSMTGLSRSKTGLHTTAALLWVDAASYLPLREVLRFSTGRVDITDFRFLRPTAANLAKLRIVIPAGYHRTWLRPGQERHHR